MFFQTHLLNTNFLTSWLRQHPPLSEPHEPSSVDVVSEREMNEGRGAGSAAGDCLKFGDMRPILSTPEQFCQRPSHFVNPRAIN